MKELEIIPPPQISKWKTNTLESHSHIQSAS